MMKSTINIEKAPPYYIFIVWGFWGISVYLILISSLSFSVSPVGGQIKEIIHTVFPQGWGFFTKNPREAQTDLYKSEGGKLVRVNLSNTSSENLYGFSRSSRYISHEISQAFANISRRGWANGTGKIDTNRANNREVILINDKYKYISPGNYIFVKYRTIPWAWAGQNQEKYAPYEFKVVTIKELRK